MKTKLLRLGFTEETLLFIHWINKYKNINNIELINLKNSCIKWLYTSSGYYDNTINSNYMDAIHPPDDTEIYNKYMEYILDFIKNSDNYLFKTHLYTNFNYDDEFIKYINPINNYPVTQEVLFDFIKNKKILIITPFSPLMKSQLENGNCKKIFDKTPIINKIYAYKFPYTFFNKGPHNNILETVDYIYNDIITNITNEYDTVIISCGAYSCLMAKKFYEYGKNVCTIGGELQYMFGILNRRSKFYLNIDNKELENKEYWIMEIPDEYKPLNYEKIEEGCYW